MSEQTKTDRRGFLKGSALFAAAAAASTLPAMAQSNTQDKTKPEQKTPAPEKKEEPAEKRKELVDKAGREYRVCDMCGGNMYKSGNTWTCEQCGFSYEV